jgi:transposase
MSLKPSPIQPVPEGTARVARAAFRKGNPLLKLRDELGAIFADADFADLFPRLGQPGLPPWRLALVTLLQFREDLADRRAAEAVRARIDWKYLLGLELDDPGFDHSVLCEFRARLLEGGAEERLLGKLLEACQARGLLKARGRQRSDTTHVLAAIRTLNRLELVGETLRAALNELATVAPDWLRAAAPKAWYERYALRVEDGRLPRTAAEREAYARVVGDDGFALLDRLDEPATPEELRGLPKVAILRQVWARHFVREDGVAPGGGGARLRAKEDPPPPATEPVESPYDTQARYRTRSGTSWVGYIVHLTEACDDDAVHLITHALTTSAAVHEARCTAAIHAALAGKGLLPAEHLVDAAYVDAELLVRSREDHGIDLVGPPRGNPTWQTKAEGGYTIDRFEVDWERERVRCPQGKLSSAWSRQIDHTGTPYVSVMFRQADCGACPARALCTRAKHGVRHLKLQPRAEYEALKAARGRLATKEGRRCYARRAGIEGTISQGVRAFGLRRSRYRGLAKTHLQHVASAAAVNLERLAAWFRAAPRAATRTSRFAGLATA